MLRPEPSAEKIAQCSQKIVDVLNLETGEIESNPLHELTFQRTLCPILGQSFTMNPIWS